MERGDLLAPEAKINGEKLTPTSEGLKRKALLLDTFINARPELKLNAWNVITTLNIFLQRTVEGVGRLLLIGNNLAGQLNNLAVKKIGLEYELEQRIDFIATFKEVCALFEKHVLEAEKAAKGARNTSSLLLMQTLENKED
ncbi:MULTISPECIES: hypothetical protein [unclassified Neochlamydia]|uniref:hypothetical protein n=1 Tax=unclassified Neochlamydia TaxID=2643326 RepID=UPI00140949E9|nr:MULTISPECIES: hypothetical protein [unclassified Neochlamydia]MBS4167358.1 hypothetical protein [Neochlamydia sp. AcF65]MBS4171420.1 hypothetical protein [Neochlamydia sp. AcF95]NGY95214.1 hypothetical protein [Neochlamydia sp. AcF84]